MPDLSTITEVEDHHNLRIVNDLLAAGWVLIDARIIPPMDSGDVQSTRYLVGNPSRKSEGGISW